MSTEITEIQGQHEVVTDAEKRLSTLEASNLYVKTFSGGEKRGKMVSFLIHQSDGVDASIQMTLDQARELIEALASALEPEPEKIQIVVLNEHTFGYMKKGDKILHILQSLILKGANFNDSDGIKYINEGDTVRLASLSDFREFRISPEGYRQDLRYEFVRNS